MAVSMAAWVYWCAQFFLVLLVNYVFCHNCGTSYTREELVIIRLSTPGFCNKHISVKMCLLRKKVDELQLLSG